MLAVPALLVTILLPGDSLVRRAEALLSNGEAWHATRALAPLLEPPAVPTPEVTLLAARAAAGWNGWTTATRLLSGQPWLDRDAGSGRSLLARAAVERGDPAALTLAHQTIRPGLPASELGPRLVTLARALDRASMLDSAAATYRRAAALLPEVGDWLHLRAAGVASDSGTRAALFALLVLPVAQARIPWTEALALERTGQAARAAAAYAGVGATLTTLRLRLVAAGTAAARAAVRQDLMAVLGNQPPAGQVGEAIALLDRGFAPLRADEQLIVARAAARAGLLERAQRGFLAAGTLDDADRLAHGTVLFRLGRFAEAVRRFESVDAASLRPEAMYQRARSLFRLGEGERAAAALRMARDSFPGSPTPAAAAGYLLGDWHVDLGDDRSARREFLTAGQRFPGTAHGDRAAFQAAILAWTAQAYEAAAAEFDAIADRDPAAPEATAAIYWSGRAWAMLGDSAKARQRWETILERFPQSYYVVPAGRRLGGRTPPAWRAQAATTLMAADSLAARALARAALLESLGLRTESRLELEGVSRAGTGDRALPVAMALAAARHPSRALQVASQAVGQGAPGSAYAPFLYPLLDRPALEREAGLVGLDPLLVAGLIRQESLYDPAARSRADARGLMQVLPSVGAATARRERYPEWDDVLLYQPDVNMHIGLRHLAERWERCGGSVEAALAAYNAGATPVNRWLRRPGTTDPEVFVERIPYVETRDYVRRVLFNQARYAALYAPAPSGASPTSD